MLSGFGGNRRRRDGCYRKQRFAEVQPVEETGSAASERLDRRLLMPGENKLSETVEGTWGYPRYGQFPKGIWEAIWNNKVLERRT